MPTRIIMAAVSLLAGILLLNTGKMMYAARPRGMYSRCGSNCKLIVEALEISRKKNGGVYPNSLSRLSPEYIPSIPTCPSARRDTYSESYQVSSDGLRYTFCCRGKNHVDGGLKPDHPMCSSEKGINLGR